MAREPQPARRPGARRIDPLGAWLCGLALLGLARAWLYLVRDAGTAGAVGWIWLGGSVLMAVVGLALVGRRLAARRDRPR